MANTPTPNEVGIGGRKGRSFACILRQSHHPRCLSVNRSLGRRIGVRSSSEPLVDNAAFLLQLIQLILIKRWAAVIFVSASRGPGANLARGWIVGHSAREKRLVS